MPWVGLPTHVLLIIAEFVRVLGTLSFMDSLVPWQRSELFMQQMAGEFVSAGHFAHAITAKRPRKKLV